MGCILEGPRSRANSLVAYLGGPRVYHSGHAKLDSLGSQGFAVGDKDDLGGTSWDIMMGGSQMGLGSRARSAIPSLVTFPN